MRIEEQRKASVDRYIEELHELLDEYGPVLLEQPQYLVDQHARKIIDKLRETTEV